MSAVLGESGRCSVTNEAAFPPQSPHWGLVADTQMAPQGHPGSHPSRSPPLRSCPPLLPLLGGTSFSPSPSMGYFFCQHHLGWSSPLFPACSCHTLPAPTPHQKSPMVLQPPLRNPLQALLPSPLQAPLPSPLQAPLPGPLQTPHSRHRGPKRHSSFTLQSLRPRCSPSEPGREGQAVSPHPPSLPARPPPRPQRREPAGGSLRERPPPPRLQEEADHRAGGVRRPDLGHLPQPQGAPGSGGGSGGLLLPQILFPLSPCPNRPLCRCPTAASARSWATTTGRGPWSPKPSGAASPAWPPPRWWPGSPS